MALYGMRAVRVSYLGSDRFVIRECHGYDMRFESRATTVGEIPLASLVVLDRAYGYAKIQEFYLDVVASGGHWHQSRRIEELYRRAEGLAAQLNEGGRCTGGPSPIGDRSPVAKPVRLGLPSE